MKQSTFSAVMATNLLNVLQEYTKGIRFVAVLLVLFTVNIGTARAEKSIDFESGTATYSDWTFTNMTSQQSGSITAKGGSYYGTTGGKATASIQTKNQISSPKSISCYVSKQSNNTSSSTWYIQTSTNGSSWTNVKTQSATSMSKGTWVEFTADLSSYSNVYVRIYYSGSTAVRNIDNLVLTEGTTTSYDVNWKVNGETYTTGSPTTSVPEGSKVTILPTAPSLDCSGKTFVGWSNEEVTDGSEPDVLFTTAENSPAITEPTTFHAVFATKGSNQTATFDAATISGLTKSSSSLTWTHNTSGIELYLSAGQRYTSGTPNTFTVTSGTSNYCQLSAPTGINMSKVIATLSGTDYKINSVSTPWTLSTSSTTQTISSTNGSDYLKMSATSSYQIRITQLVVTYATYSDYTTSCTTETVVTLNPNGGTFETNPPTGWTDNEDGTYSKTVIQGELTELPQPTRAGYKFNGWKEGNSTNTTHFTPTEESHSLTAQWTCYLPTFTLTSSTFARTEGQEIRIASNATNVPANAKFTWYLNGAEVANQSSSELYIASCTIADAGNYTCTISYDDCSFNSTNNYSVKIYSVRGLKEDWNTLHPFTSTSETEGEFSIYLDANTSFKVWDGEYYYGNPESGTMSGTSENWTMQQNKGGDVTMSNVIAGTYTFKLDYSDAANTKISVYYPEKKIVYFNPGDWSNSKYAVYSWEGEDNSTVLMTKVDDCTDRNIYQAEIDASHNNVIFIGGNASYDVSDPWNNVEHKTIDLTYPSDDKVLFDRTQANTTHLFLTPNTNWKTDGARFAAYFFDNGESWSSMSYNDKENIYYCVKMSGYPSVIFCRMNPSTTENNWNNKWNQSSDLSIPTNGTNHYTVKGNTWDNGGGTWSTVNGDWTAFTPNYTVTFNANGHGTAPEDQCIVEGGKATQPTPEPTATGYTFGGWYEEAGCTNVWDFANDVVTADITLYAKWTINTHTVTWKPAGGNWDGDASDIVQEYEYGAVIEAPDKPTYDCHEFVEWNPAYTVGKTMPDEDLEFTAQWTKLSYTITFKNYDGTVLQTSTVECGETPTYTGATPTREQTAQYTYTFSGWSPAIAPATKNQDYTAQFNQTTRSYTVIWYDGTGNAHKTQTADYNATVALPTTNPDPCDDDYPHFIGWTADPITGSTTTQPALVENVKVTGDCDYYAVFAKGEAGENGSYTLDYEVEGLKDSNKWGSYGTSYSHTANDGSTWVIKAYKNLGMQINTGKNASIKIPTCPSPITSIEVTGTASKAVGLSASDYTGSETITYIASGTDATNQTLDLSGESVTGGYIVAKSGSISITKVIVNFGAQTEYTSFITTCCTSWAAPTLTYPTELEENGTAMPQVGAGTTHGTVTYASSNPSILSVNSTTGEISAQAPGTATVTATWSGDETYCSVSSTSNVITVKGSFSVIYNANGGTGTMANQKADENNKIAQLNANQFTRTGYAFVGWNTSSYGTGTAYTDQQTNITLAQNLTLYAQWAPVVTLNDAGNEETAHPTAVGGTVTLPDGANACEPYEFVGWTSVAIADWNGEIEEPELVTSPYKPTQPTTLYAVYKIQDEGNPNAFKLSYNLSGTPWYVGTYGSSPYIKAYSTIIADDAVTFYKEKIENNTEKYWVYFERYDSYYEETTKEYLYVYNNDEINTTNNPSETQGWIITKLADGTYEFQSIGYSTKYLSFSDSGNSTDHTVGTRKTFNLLPAVSSTYYAIPDCDVEIKITFETGNGDFIANTPATNPLVVTPGETITLPTCDYSGDGIEFIGWLKNTPQEELSDIIAEVYYEGGEEYVVNDTRDVIFYAYYKVTPEEVEFTGQDDAELKIYHYNGVDNYYYANTFVGEHAELAGIERCFDATTWKFTNVGNMQYYIQDETGKYLGAVSDSDNDFSLSNTPKIWNFTLIDGLWRMICEDSPSRALMYMSTGKCFRNAALSNINNSAYSYVTLGICPDDGYTTNPVLSQGFSITNTAMVTSASGQKVKATTALTLETRNIELPCTFTISAPNITFYDNTGAEVTQLTASTASEQFELHFAYKPTAENTMEYPTITITDDEMKTYTIKNRIYARSLPATFAIVAKVGNLWYALPSQGLNSTTPPAAYPVEVDDMADPTTVTAVPENADWSLRGVYEASRSDATKDRYVANGDNLVFVNNASPAMTLNASSSEEENYLLTDAQYNNYYSTNPGLYEWTPTTTDLETYQLTNEQRGRTLSVNIATVFGVHAQDKAVEQVRFLPIQNRYTPAALQVVEWKENSVVIMYNGDPAQTAFVSVNGGKAQETVLSSAQRDIAVYELAANGLAANPTQRLSITIGAEKVILSIPYIISGAQTDLALLPGSTVAARQEVAKVSDLVILKDATLTADGAKSNLYKFRNVTIYGGGKLVIPSEAKGFGVASLTLRAGGITDAGEYDYVYPQFELRGTFTNSAAKINYDYITDYDHWFHLVLPFAGDLGTIKYPTEFYGANVNADNKGSWVIKRYAGEIRATGNYEAWKDIEEDNPKATQVIAGQGYIFWGAPKKVSVNGGASTRQKWGIQRITMSVTAPNAMTAENGDKAISELSSYANVPNNSGKDNDQGWNLIGNPYMVNLTDMATTGLHACKLVEVIDPATGKWNGKWEWNDETNIRYLTIPSEHFDTYTAKTVNQAVPLVAGRAFFVQLEGEADGITFAAANRASLMPALRAANDKPVDIETGIVLSNETLQDEVNFWIKDGKTNDYEYNADYPKTPNNNQFNIYGVHTNGDLSWVATGPEYAAESMPIGYQVPAAGTYMLSLSEIYNSDGLDALYVTDHALSPEVTVDIMSEPYEFSVNQAETNNERFTVSVRVKAKTENGATGLDNVGADGEQIHKFIYQDKIFILHHGVIYDATGKRVITINK